MKTILMKSDMWQVASDRIKGGTREAHSCHVSRVTRHPSGFTLVEMLVVIAIIAILAALLLPVLAGAKKAAQKKQAAMEIGQIVGAIQQYDSVYGRFPVSKEDQALAGTNDFTCGRTAYTPTGTPLWDVGVTNNAEVIAILMDVQTYGNGVKTANFNHVKNPQQTIFLPAKMASETNSPGVGPDGVYRDPWGNPYVITMDLNYDEMCKDAFYSQTLVSSGSAGADKNPGLNGLVNPDATGTTPDNYQYHGKVMVWSAGPDKMIETNSASAGFNKDNILSWQ